MSSVGGENNFHFNFISANLSIWNQLSEIISLLCWISIALCYQEYNQNNQLFLYKR